MYFEEDEPKRRKKPPFAASSTYSHSAKDYNMLPLRSRASVKPKNPKKYAFQLSKVIALVSVAPAISALIGLWNILVAAIVLIAAVVLFIWLGTKIMKDVE
ncbi:MAG: hypothetical protein J5836_02065 [Clostridia bacterium]|nr:hypothetical protein [Clostridia bacterium]